MRRKTIGIISIILAGLLTCISFGLMVETSASQTISITKAEYFFDQDPGEGNGTPLPQIDSEFNDEAVFSTDISLPDLPPGVHVVYVRMQNSDGQWSDVKTTSIAVAMVETSAPQTMSTINAEYFIDQDPGVGNGTPLPRINDESNDEAVFSTDIPFPDLPPGVHVINVRMQNSDGQWSDVKTTSIVATDEFIINPEEIYLVAAQYAIDVLPDNKLTNVITLPGGQDTADALWQDVEVSGLALGAHRMYVRFEKADGVWSPFRCYPFIVIDEEISLGQYGISGAEYFIDNDPGVGNAIPLQPLDGSFDRIQEDAWLSNIDISNLPLGEHTVYVRIKNNAGMWGFVRSFGNQISRYSEAIITGSVKDAKTNAPLSGVTIDFDGTYFAVTDGIGKFELAGVPLGTHEIRANAEGYLPYQNTVTIQGLSLLNISLAHATTICGYIRDKATKQPIPNAQITIGGSAGFTNQKGYYWITDIAGGTFTVVASAKGHKTLTKSGVSIVEHMVTSDINFSLEKGLDGEEDYPAPYDKEKADSKTDETFVTKAGDPDGGNLGVYTNGQIEFKIAIDRYYGELQDPDDPDKAYLKDPDKLKNNNVVSTVELKLKDVRC